ncbi:hypothetical protein SISNIDRAFT_262610 [Sistotremastrum niveocremeum HHB9708]|uniref:Uncharacterized protein n=2 Tax=Sistotremastraceae TaxID=3402574 RepID=A0A164PAZ3_9AGAM|nr:hypothetical protein SISNIDRAFT_262610 [Sistotremastrum niveocremeum HHB9708]KZT32837.1 hypothetical protein SISSUDRAFT_475320 [Sistotremastrum suecicum HHB10207 ss-3]
MISHLEVWFLLQSLFETFLVPQEYHQERSERHRRVEIDSLSRIVRTVRMLCISIPIDADIFSTISLPGFGASRTVALISSLDQAQDSDRSGTNILWNVLAENRPHKKSINIVKAMPPRWNREQSGHMYIYEVCPISAWYSYHTLGFGLFKALRLSQMNALNLVRLPNCDVGSVHPLLREGKFSIYPFFS